MLNDDELLIIFKMFTLNERTHLRLVSRRFKSLLDSIKINKLIIYEKMPALPGQLIHTNEPYGILDTVEVYDLNKFFNNPAILDQLEPIRQLVIEGHRKEKDVDLNTVFKKLTYLKLRNVLFTNSSLLQSTEIEHLMLECSFFNSIENCIRHMKQIGLSTYKGSPSVFKFQFNDLKSRRIKYLHLDTAEFAFLDYCVDNGLFNSLEEIHFKFHDFRSLLLLNDRCPTLKKVNCLVGEDTESFFREADQIEHASQQLRDDLSVYLFGTYVKSTSCY